MDVKVLLLVTMMRSTTDTEKRSGIPQYQYSRIVEFTQWDESCPAPTEQDVSDWVHQHSLEINEQLILARYLTLPYRTVKRQPAELVETSPGVKNAKPPVAGDLILVKETNWYASLGEHELYEATHHGLIRKSNLHQGRAFFGPSHYKADDEHYSASGGPFIGVEGVGNWPSKNRLERLEYVGVTDNNFWRWKEYPCAGGGEGYNRQVCLFTADKLVDGWRETNAEYLTKKE